MIIRKINLLNFRNYSKCNITLNDKMNIFVGDNAQGKTNILEAITILALTKSHRVGNSPNIIQFGKNKCSINGTIKNNKIITKLSIAISEEEKIELLYRYSREIEHSDENLKMIEEIMAGHKVPWLH